MSARRSGRGTIPITGSGRRSPSRMSASAREIFDVIRCFGERGKLFNVHFRNIKGKKLDVPG